MAGLALMSIVLFEHAFAEVADADHALKVETSSLDDVRGTSSAENLATDAAVMLAAKRGEDGETLAAFLCVFVGHPEFAAQTLASHAPIDGICTSLKADLCRGAIGEVIFDGVGSEEACGGAADRFGVVGEDIFGEGETRNSRPAVFCQMGTVDCTIDAAA